MKHARKLTSLLLALVMVFALATAAFAAGTNGAITISSPVAGQTYNAYLMFELESYNTATGAYSYKITDAWRDFVTTGAGKDYFSIINGQDYVTLKAGVTVEDNSAAAATIAKAAVAYAASKRLEPAATLSKDGGYTASGLKLGYYVVDSTLGTLCSLDTTNPSVTMNEKNAVPENHKTVKEDSTLNYGEKNDADIGQTVNFKSTITAQPGAENYVFHDQMSTGLTYKNDAKVYTDENMTQELAADNYTVNASPEDGNTFDISFEQNYLNTINAETKLYVKYSATLNENAVIAGEGNPNTSKLSYGDSTNTKYTPDSQTKTYTWDFNIFKYTKNAQNQEVPLSGAKFTLSKNANGSEPISLIATTEVGNSEHEEDEVEMFTLSDTTMTYRVAKEGETGVTEFEVGSDGKVIVQGLDAGTYYLTETQAPAGYNKLPSAIKVTIDSAGNVKKDAGTEALANKTVKVENQAGTLLPSTGGMGTTIFYVLGSILAIGAAVLLVTKKRMNAVDR